MKKLLACFVFTFMLSSCADKAGETYCITALDCKDGLLCIDGVCSEKDVETGSDDGNGDSGNTGNSGEPNDSTEKGAIMYSDGTWNDTEHTDSHPYVCEVKKGL